MLVERVDHDPERHVALVFGAAALQHQHPGLTCVSGQRAQQLGLADPRLTDHADHPAAAPAGVLDRPRQRGELAIASDELHVRKRRIGSLPYSADREDIGGTFALNAEPRPRRLTQQTPRPAHRSRHLRNLRQLLWPRPKRVRTAFALAGALLLCAASAAHAGIALNTIDRNVTHARDGAHVRATGPIGCTRGERIAITLRVSQAATGARARGRWAGRCTGDVQHWKVRARARGNARFTGGRGKVCAVGRTRAGGRVTDARRWCRRVSVSTRAANAMDEDDRGLDWRPCGGRFQCASLKVPLDYSRPRWRTIEIPVLKLPATDPARRIGTAIGGAGGPGQSGIDLLRNVGETAFAPLNERFDLVTFDQRGVGTIDCGPLPDPDPGFAEPFDVDTKLVARRAREIGRRCLDRNPVLLPYVTTGNAARDMDRLRAAVGERKLTYLGGSYGTMLGATYASLFPRNVRAMALDGPLDVDVVTRRPLEACASTWSTSRPRSTGSPCSARPAPRAASAAMTPSRRSTRCSSDSTANRCRSRVSRVRSSTAIACAMASSGSCTSRRCGRRRRPCSPSSSRA
jgi:pimeloyl-ACP methyl ester carboxylesterase